MKKFMPAAGLVAACLCHAGDWPTFGGDPQRDGWARKESKISKESVKTMALDWKLQLDNQPVELNSLTPPVVVEQVITNRGFKDMVIVAGASDTIFAIDADTGKQIWKKTFQVQGKAKQQAHWLCPNALNDTPVIEKGRQRNVHVISSDGRLHSLNVVDGEDRQPPVQFVPPFSKNWSLNLVDGILYTTISQGCNGAKSGAYAMDLRDPNRKISSFISAPAGGGAWGRGGAAVGSDGRIYFETGDGPYDAAAGKLTDSLIALTPKDLKLSDYYTPANRDWITRKDLDMGNITPVVFPFQGRELIAGAGKEGLLYLLDAKSLGGDNHRKPLFRSPLYTNEDVDFAGRGFWGAFASWQDPAGTRWLYAPALGPVHSKAPAFPITNGGTPNGSIMAFKVEMKDGSPVLTPAWISRDLDIPEPPVVANGVVFALSNGEDARQAASDGHLMNSKERIARAHGNAVLYAFDAQSGKELYNSGNDITGFAHFSGLAISNGRVFASTYDGHVYAFGLKAEGAN